MCFVRISEQRETFTSYNINWLVLYIRGGKCLLLGKNCPYVKQPRIVFKGNSIYDAGSIIIGIALLADDRIKGKFGNVVF
jgi:hypothetical protein